MIKIVLLICTCLLSAHSFGIFIDETTILNIDQIQKKDKDFKYIKGISYNIKHTDKPIWIKKTLINDSKQSKSFIVNLRPTIIQNAEFYRVFDNKIESFKKLDRKFLTIEVPKNSSVDVYAGL